MKKKYTYVVLIIIINLINSQVGINTTSIKSTLDIRAKNHLGDGEITDGLLIPRVSSLPQLNPLSPDNNDRRGQLLYLINPYDNYNQAGFYHWDGFEWVPRVEEIWNIEGTKIPATLNNQNIYHIGNVGIGTMNPTTKLDINGNLKFRNGTEGNNKVLMSDDDGNATWQNNLTSKITLLNGVIGPAGTGANLPTNNMLDFIYTGSYIDIPANTKCIVNANMVIAYNVVSNQYVFVRTSFADSIRDRGDGVMIGNISNDFENRNRYISGGLYFPFKSQILSGSVIIKNTSNVTKRYYYMAYVGESIYSSFNGTILNFGSKTHPENSITAQIIEY